MAKGTNSKKTGKAKNRPTKKKVKKPEKPSALDAMQGHVSSFLNDLDCILEAFDVVDPILAAKDKERRLQVDETMDRLKSIGGDQSKAAERYEQIVDFVSNIRRLGRGHFLYRNSSLISLVSRFDEFIGDLIRGIHKLHPDRLKKSEKTLNYEEITALTNLEQAVDRLIDKEVDKVLRDSHAAQIKYLELQLSVQIREILPVWSEFIELTERRNLLVHCGGEVSSQYLRNCKQNGCPAPASLTEGNILHVESAYLRRCHSVLIEVSTKLAQTILRNLFPRDLRRVDSAINTYGIDLLTQGRSDLALMVFDYLCGLPTKLTSEEGYRKIFQINKAISLKFSGKNSPCQQLLNSVDWSSCGPDFTLAVAVLRDDFDKAEKIMAGMNGEDPIEEADFKTWPLFREFRRTEHFRRAFKTVYAREFEPKTEAKKAVDALHENKTLSENLSPIL